MQMNDQQWFFVKLAVGTVLMWFLFNWVLPRVGVNSAAMAKALIMTVWVWGLWHLGKIAGK